MVASLVALAPLGAQTLQNAVTDIAQLWSASKSPPRCTRAPGLTRIERLQAAFACQWKPPPSPNGGTISGTVQPATGLTVVTWMRPTRDPDDVIHVRDSLANVLEAIGMKEKPCGDVGADVLGLWVGREVAVHVTRIDERTGKPHLQLVATTDLLNTPGIHCRIE
jgi:hypothetical protein